MDCSMPLNRIRGMLKTTILLRLDITLGYGNLTARYELVIIYLGFSSIHFSRTKRHF